MFGKALFFFITFALISISAAAEDVGTIYGGIWDSNGNPLIGATILVPGTADGAMSDANGSYQIDSVPVGIYTVQASMVGMSAVRISGVEVKSGEAIRVDFGSPYPSQFEEVEPEIIEAEETEETEGSIVYPVIVEFDDDPQSGRFQAATAEGIVFDLPLEHTSVEITVSGCMQTAVVRQEYGNPADVPIEAIYTFPLPEDGAVNSMNMYIGERLIKGLIYEREQAEQVYTEAIQSGQTASMLSQERPNIFTQKVGNILPGDNIAIEITYAAPVSIRNGIYEVVFPTVVGPRFIPGMPTGPSTSGWSPPTTLVPDADLITPPVLPEGLRSGYDIDISVTINAGLGIHNLESLNHDVIQDVDGPRAQVELVNESEIPNRDFVLRYDTGTDRIETALITHEDNRGGFFMLIIQPEAEVVADRITPKEMFFVVDCSGSMSGAPMDAAKQTMRMFISGMNPDDSFQITRYSNSASSMSEEPLSNTPENVQQGLAFVDAMYGGGGTMMLGGVRAAIDYPADPDKIRYVIFLTDGYIGNETEILGEIASTLGENIRFFSVGIGSSVNRYLIEGMAEEGRGQSFYIDLQEDPTYVVESIYRSINNPYIMDLDIDWNEFDVTDTYPRLLQDIYPGDPVFITGRFNGSGGCTIQLRGMIDMKPWDQTATVFFPYVTSENDAIPALWARNRIHDLERQLLTATHEDPIVTEITTTALLYNLVSDYTSFVAVSEEVRVDSAGNPVTVQVPVNMPEGVSYEGVFGNGTPPQGATTIQYGSSSHTGLQASSVGNTTITVTDSRGLYSMENMNPNVSKVHISPDLGLSDYQLTVALHALIDDLAESYSSILEELIDEEAFGQMPTGLMRLDVTFTSEGVLEEISIVSNQTGSEELAEKVADILMSLEIPSPPEGAGTISFTLSFELY